MKITNPMLGTPELQACRKVVERPDSGKPTDCLPEKTVTEDELRTSRVSSAVNSPQPYQEELDRSEPTRPEGLRPPTCQVQDRLLRDSSHRVMPKKQRKGTDKQKNCPAKKRKGKGIAEHREFELIQQRRLGWAVPLGTDWAPIGQHWANPLGTDPGPWLAPIRPHLQHLAAASSTGTSLVANLKHITVTLATWDAVREVYLEMGTAAAEAVPLYGDHALEQLFKQLEEDMAEVSMERHGHAKQPVVLFGAASIGTRGGWGADAVLRACCTVVCRPRGTDQRRGRVVLVDGHGTTQVSSAVNGQQPCEWQLNNRRATRPADWKPPAGQLLRPAWSQQRDPPVRGLMWCSVATPRKPPQALCSSQQTTPAAATEPGPSTPPPAKRSKRTKAEQAAEPTQPTKAEQAAEPTQPTKAEQAAELSKGKAAKAKPAPQPGRWLDRDCNAALNMQRIGESRWHPLELCWWPKQTALPGKGKEYPGLGYKRLRDKPPKAQL
ncbi:hypothetical protein QJQ45_016502 [Haematococcus lacustris]|nr:hypothetical protein QJQ45_016502 [Haematococcus lacustris]